MANLVNAITNTLKFASGGAQETQDRIETRQGNQVRQRALDDDRDKRLGGMINGTTMQNYVRQGGEGENLWEFDAVGAYKENPELTMELLGSVPASALSATDEKGNKINIKPTGIRELGKGEDGQERFAIEVTRPDGKKAPLTWRGTAAPDDNVIVMTRDQLNGLASQRIVGMFNNGGFDNNSFFQRSIMSIPDAAARDAAVEQEAVRSEMYKMLEDGEVPSGVAREMLMTFSSLRGEELIEAAKEFGVDVDSVVADAQSKLQEQMAAMEADDKPGVFDAAADPENVDASNRAAMDGLNRIASIFTGPKQPAGTGAGGKGAVGGGGGGGGGGGWGGPADTTEKAQARLSGVEPKAPGESSIIPAGESNAPPDVQRAIAAPQLNPDQRRAAILGAISGAVADPTDAQKDAVREYMLARGYDSPEKLVAAPGSEVANIAWTLAAASNGDMATKMSVAQSILNYAQFGNPETNALDVAKLNMDQRKLNMQATTETRLTGEAQTKRVEAVRELQTDANELVTEAAAGIPVREGSAFIKGGPSKEADLAVDTLLRAYDNAASIGDEDALLVYGNALKQALPRHVTAKVIGERDTLIERFGTGGLVDWLARAPARMHLSPSFGDFRVKYTDDGRPTHLIAVTPKGVDAENGMIDLVALQGILGNKQYKFFMDMVEENSPYSSPPKKE